MHTFQPYPLELLEWNPWEKISTEWLAIITEKDGKANAMTASWAGISYMWDKRVMHLYVRESRYTREMLDGSDYFSGCFLNNMEINAKSTLKYLGAVSGRDEDKIANARLHLNHDNGIPYVDEANFAILCKKIAKIPITKESILDNALLEEWYKEGDYHYMYIGEIMNVLAR